MTYNPAIPAANDLISQSQAQIQTNFSQLDLIFDIDHVTYDNATAGDRGKHRAVTLTQWPHVPLVSVDPTTAVDEMAIYAKDLAGVETLYLRKESNGTIIQMSGSDPVTASTGSTFLPGGLILNWGSRVGTGSVIYATAFTSAVYSATITSNQNTVTTAVSALNLGNIVIGGAGTGSAGATYFFIAIGK